MDLAESISRNRRSLESWDRFFTHRDRVTGWIERLQAAAEAADGKTRLGVLGAGNVNDLDLSVLAKRFQRIVLFDWDHDAVVAGVERQMSRAETAWNAEEIDIPPPIDLVSESEELSAFGPLDVIASVGLLSQMMELQLAQLTDDGIDDPVTISERLHQVRSQHFRIIDQMLAPGGTALVTTEFVSSDTLPGLVNVPENQLANFLRDALMAGNFFSGMQPASVLDSARRVFQNRSRRIEPGNPWLWDFGPRIYAVVPYCILPSRREAPLQSG